MHDLADDAWETSARGFGPGFTWPNGLFPCPPIRIDHIFVSHDLGVVRRVCDRVAVLSRSTTTDEFPCFACDVADAAAVDDTFGKVEVVFFGETRGYLLHRDRAFGDLDASAPSGCARRGVYPSNPLKGSIARRLNPC